MNAHDLFRTLTKGITFNTKRSRPEAKKSQIVKPVVNDINVKEERTKEDEISKVNEENNKKRKRMEDEIEDNETLTLLDGLSVPKDGSISTFKKHKKVATTDKMLKLEQEKV
ncbi:hypothetical protein EAI_13792 [Harpegnathos saltator]|uniref:Uncharacterized protein n=1 Tax=Harpegnathos saltator TaxID=610380 RepID=E2BXA1_HARSA|nr:hypothetical protein EAI_13792 [Harpegnathos saltator]